MRAIYSIILASAELDVPQRGFLFLFAKISIEGTFLLELLHESDVLLHRGSQCRYRHDDVIQVSFLIVLNRILNFCWE